MHRKHRAAVLAIVAAVAVAAATAGGAAAAAGDLDNYYFDCVRQIQLDPASEAGVQSYLFGPGGLFATYGDSVPMYTNAPAGETFAQLLLDPVYVIRPTPAPGYHVVGTLQRNACPAAAQPENGVFLCYSRWQVEPGVWGEKQAAELLSEGYWRPYAVAGAVGATRVGSYSLTCSMGDGRKAVEGELVDGGGLLLGPAGGGLYELAA